MRVFRCDHCKNLVFFENVFCVKCNRPLAFLPDQGVVGSLDESPREEGVFRSPLRRARGQEYRLCVNYTEHNVCNWAVRADDPEPRCQSCRLTRVIPDLSRPGQKEAWYKLEVAKRRLAWTLIHLKLVRPDADPATRVSFEFLADPEPGTDAPPVLTGHANGVITINTAEADDAERERRRIALGEPYRTLLGHFRHEIGHFYWDRLIAPHPGRLDGFRKMFGDERADYGDALKAHYANGPAADWQARCVSTYATAHPWEDWAETWAHYLHMLDTLETAAACGVSLRPPRKGDPAVRTIPDPFDDVYEPFDELIESWFPLTYLLNNLNRGLGVGDAYPFVLSPPAIEKLRFVHDTVAAAAGERKA